MFKPKININIFLTKYFVGQVHKYKTVKTTYKKVYNYKLLHKIQFINYGFRNLLFALQLLFLKAALTNSLQWCLIDDLPVTVTMIWERGASL